MHRWIVTRLLPLLLAAAGLGLLACDEPDCEAACRHTCDVCASDCTEEDVQACVVRCEGDQSEQDRVDCVIATPACEDLWKC